MVHFAALLGLLALAMADPRPAHSQLLNVGPLQVPPILCNVLNTGRTFPVRVTDMSPWMNPPRLTITICDTVKWTNLSAGTHTLTSILLAEPETGLDNPLRTTGLEIGGFFDRRDFEPAQSYSVIFANPGVFPYLCFIHPWM